MSVRAFALALVVSAAATVSCGSTNRPCNITNCTGCCDGSGVCQTGVVNEACGAGASSCTACSSFQACTFGQCVTQQQQGGGNGGGGGSATGGGTALDAGIDAGTGGGDAGATGGGGGSTGCGPSTCTGCCSSSGTCITVVAQARCGSGGNACNICSDTSTCLNGMCTECAGCIDINTGVCASGTSAASCGSAGRICQVCNSGTCSAGLCTGSTGGGGGSNTGGGVATGGGTAAGGGTGTGGGIPGLGDGGIGATCATAAECGPSQCCGIVFGTIGLCADPGASCISFGGTATICNGATQTCQ